MTTITIDFEYKKGNISSTQTIDKIHMTIAKAKARAAKMENCIGFCIESSKKPSGSKEYLCHFKEGAISVIDHGNWHTHLCPEGGGGGSTTVALKSGSGPKSGLQVPGGRKGKHARTVTNFCKEANIAESDQLDLAEFIVAARYLGTEANDEQLMNVFMDMEETNEDTKDPKQLIKDLMAKVDEEYGLGDDDNKLNGDDEDGNYNEVMMENPLEAFANEDNLWQGQELDKIFMANEEDSNIKIALNLLNTTALTVEEIAEITGVDKEKLQAAAEEEEDYSTEEEDEEEEDEPEEDAGGTDAKPATKTVSLSGKGGAGGVTIKASDLGKSVALTKEDLGLLKQLVDGGKDKVAEKGEDSHRLLSKFQQAIQINPTGKLKRNKTLAKLNSKKLEKVVDDAKEKEVKLPTKYRVVIHPGALCKEGKELSSGEVCKLPIGTVVRVINIEGRRAQIDQPNKGWLSLHASDGRTILQRANVKSDMMDKAIHAERARQTKVLILKSITTLNDATVTRILEKSDWNLRRAIEAFYIAKYKTQEYLTKKEKQAKSGGGSKSSKSGGDKSSSKGDAAKKKGKMAWWKSWKTFANDNP
mmetsp:Transcript_57429/g.51720  ORF Transcript_57429/g.51720 Transcript_57429/m.51720 type:complete len:587 (+) Transcript_57429:206-1966(+)